MMAEAQDPGQPARIALPGLVEAENFVAVQGTAERRNLQSTEAGVGQAVTPTSAAISLNYPVNVDTAGLYNVKIRYAHVSGEAPRLSVMQDGSAALATITLGGTGSDENFQTSVIRDLPFAAGDQTLTVTLEGDGQGGSLLNWLYLEPVRSTAAADITISIDPVGGADSNSGDPGSPFQTLQQGFDRLAEIIAADPEHGPIELVLQDGYHEITSTLRLTAAHAGTATGPIRVKGAEGAYVRVGGGRKVPNELFELVDDEATLARLHPDAAGKVYKATLTDDWASRFPGIMSYNDVNLQLARFPNKGLTTAVDTDSTSFKTFEPIDGAQWAAEFDASGEMFIEGHIIAAEFNERDEVADVSVDGRITYATLRDVDPRAARGSKLFINNVLAELDIPGEFYYDRLWNDLFIWPVTPLSSNPDIRVGGDFELIIGEDLDFLSFENIHFQDNGLWRGDNPAHMVILRGSNLEMAGNHFRNSLARSTLRLADGRNNRIRSNDFYDVAAPFNLPNSDRTLPLSTKFDNNEAVNNHIFSTFARGYGGSGVVIGVGSRLANNLFHDLQGGGQLQGNSDLLLELNEVYDSGWENGDWNIFYHGVSYAIWGNVVRYNFFHNMVRPARTIRAGAVRTDDGGQGVAYTGNIFYKTGDYGIAFAGAGGTVSNNIAVETESLFLAEENSLGGEGPIRTAAEVDREWDEQTNCLAEDKKDGANKFCAVDNARNVYGVDRYFEDPHFRYKYPVAAEAYDTNPFNYTGGRVEQNYVAEVVNPVSGSRGDPETFPFAIFEQPMPISPADFRDLEILDLNFRDGFQRQPGFRPIPFDQIGLYIDQYRTSTPHKPTYRAGAKLRWQAFASNSRGHRATPENENIPYRDPEFARASQYDLGSYSSPLFQNYDLLTEDTTGSYGWASPEAIQTADRGEGEGGNAINRDLLLSSSTGVFEQDVDNGAWYALVTLGDAAAGRDAMFLRMEGQLGDSEIDTGVGEFVNACAEALVTDGRLTLEIGDAGGSDGSWSATRIKIRKKPFEGCSNIVLPAN